MSIIIARQNQVLIIDLLEKLLAETMFHHLKTDQVQGIRDHIAWLRLNKGTMLCQATLATDPPMLATTISFTLKPQALRAYADRKGE